ncbi:hypothetical protein HYALB_00009044 [Hymenoscyphus albidus]|uniref:Glucosidase 2 subunit beta n=1 Tax=Hymenoscyphus albidus TaxID=595503 RepID=A0A9N9LFZ0_9HELO|nr:hypothetical protein HYALB_00009044 [Hymenoscyphus albidus]
MKRVEALVLLGTLASSVPVTIAAETARPRGVGPEFSKYYKSPETFTCISHPSIVLLLTQINDEFCDCPDGSDEPGTAACTYLSTLSPPQPGALSRKENQTLALPGFYCKNKGHIPGYVPHMYVNDGVCDYEACCDGSDEWAGVGGVKCKDRCVEIGKEWRKADEERGKRMREAMRRKGEMVQLAKTRKEEVVREIGEKEAKIRGLGVRERELKTIYEDIERRERGRVTKGSGGGVVEYVEWGGGRERGRVTKGGERKGNKVTILAGLAKDRVEELLSTLNGVVAKKNGLQEKVKELEGILAKFQEERNPNFNDEGVKRAVKSWEDYAANRMGVDDDEATQKDLEAVMRPDSETEGINWAEWEAEEEGDTDAIYAFEEYLPAPVRVWVHQKIVDFRIMLVENGILADNANSGHESKAVTTARSAHQAVSDELNSAQTSLGDLERDRDTDYGPQDIFRALKDECISRDSGEYEYELCWLGGTTQKSKKGGGHTGMGQFKRFDLQVFDEEVGPDGKGVGSGERVVMRYEGGQTCWNGPARETLVVLACAEKGEIWKVVEREKCLYRMDVGTPAVCERGGKGNGGGGGEKKEEGKDEL